jgi:radical SAM/Cys-rich protein
LIIIDRCNLTVLQEPGQDDLVEFLQRHRVHIIASLPCYSADNVDTQRGGGVFERSIAGLLALNRAGYGHPTIPTTTQQDDEDKDSGAPLLLDLVYNPLGGFLPPPQEKLQAQYKTQLHDNFGILFNSLYTITNMPIKRFADFLHRRDELEDYMALLVRNFNPDTVSELMCLDTINIGWDGKVRPINDKWRVTVVKRTIVGFLMINSHAFIHVNIVILILCNRLIFIGVRMLLFFFFHPLFPPF